MPGPPGDPGQIGASIPGDVSLLSILQSMDCAYAPVLCMSCWQIHPFPNYRKE